MRCTTIPLVARGESSLLSTVGPSEVLTRFARDQGLRLVLIWLGTAIGLRVIRIALWRVRKRLGHLSFAGRRAADPERIQLFFDVLNYIGTATAITIGILSALSTVGVRISALLTSAGVVGVALGFGAQTVVRDLLNGLFLLAEGQYTIGETIEVNGVSGVVERVTLRTTTLQAANGDVHIVPSGDVRLVANKSKGDATVFVDVGVTYATPVDHAFAVLANVCDRLSNNPDFADYLLETPGVLGIEAFRPDKYELRLAAKVTSDADDRIGRAIQSLVREAFEDARLAPPTTCDGNEPPRQPSSPSA